MKNIEKKGNHSGGRTPRPWKDSQICAARNILNTKSSFPTAPASLLLDKTRPAARITLLFTGPIGPLLSNIHRNRHLFHRDLLFSCKPRDRDQRPTTLQDNKGPIPDQDRGVTGERRTYEIEKDIPSATLWQVTEKVQKKGAQQ